MAPLLKAFVALAAATTFVAQVSATVPELPPCLDPFTPFVYAGCFAEKGTKNEDAVDGLRSKLNQFNMTTQDCVAECKGNSFRYAGLIAGGVCYCGHTVNSPLLDESACDKPCSGASNEKCGSGNAITVWADPTFPDVKNVEVSSYKSLGCYSDDNTHGRTIAERQFQVPATGFTIESCVAACAADGSPFAGIEYGSECYCGPVIGNYSTVIPNTSCNMPCPGDSTKTCGGPNAVEIFVSTDLISLEPCGHKPPVNSPSSSLPVISSTSIPDISSTSFPAPPSSTAVSSQAPPPPSSTAVSSQAPPPPSSTAVSSQAPPPPSSTAVSSQAPPPPSSTTVSSQAPPSTTRGPSTTPQPPVTSKPPTTSSTSTRPALCSTTIITPATCEYGCGNWCNKNLPDFDDKESCQSARNRCKLQINACFKGAGFPGNANCHEFKAWCNDVESYCSNSCSSKKGSCSKKDCYQKKVPKGYKPGTTSVSTFACPSTPTSTSTPVTVVPPPPTGICKQPTSSSWLLKYGPGNPVGGIEIPIVTCNDVLEDFKSGNQFKLYTESDSRRCKGYGKNQVPNACAEACLEQYTECQNVYAQGCKAYNNRRRGGGYSSAPDIAKRFFFGDTWSVAINKCKIQYSDCLYENKNVLIQNKCGAFGTNY